ncbi:MAG: NAD(P)/FAD-dependent oxidoreductase, partial [Halodesulfurarchaeum sp.]
MHVAVFGGGYAGIVAVKRLERRLSETVRIELVDPRETHLVKHKLHRLVRRPALRDDLEIPFEEILDRTEWRQDAVEAIHPDAGRAELRSGTELAYDAGIVAFGATPDFFGMDDVRRRAIPLDTPAQAIRIGEATRSLLEDGSGSIVVGGGGLAGVQLAGELAAIVRAADGEDITIELIEQEPRIVPQESKQFAEALSNALEEAGVRIRTGTSVVGADESGVEIEPAEVRPADLFVWTGGIRGRMATEKKRYTVRADLRVGKRTYGSGDA